MTAYLAIHGTKVSGIFKCDNGKEIFLKVGDTWKEVDVKKISIEDANYFIRTSEEEAIAKHNEMVGASNG